jgi:hypothetical protein
MILLVVLLAAPSIYLLLKFPPLWRDSDGFYQISAAPGELTILHWPPLYCFLARLPIALGEIINAYLCGHSFPGFRISPPTFTDLGVLLLVSLQHVFLIVTLLFICISLTDSPLIRILVGGLFALSPPLYAFAHCVGSESLSNILTLLIAILGYKCLDVPIASKGLLFGFGGGLVAAVLTRHINSILSGLVPGTYALALALSFHVRLRARMTEASISNRHYVRLCLKFLFLGGLSVLCANLIVGGVCRLSKIPYRSRIGYTFEWRLFYLASLSRESQEKVLEKVDKNLHDPAVSFALNKGRDMLAATNSWDASVLHSALDEWLTDHGVMGYKGRHLEADRRLNRIALQFLLQGGWDFWGVVTHEFWTTLNYSPSDICREAFRTTDIFIRMSIEPAFVPVRNLSTLKPHRESYESECTRDPYLTVGQHLPLWTMMVSLLAAASWLFLFQPEHVPEISLYAVSLIVTGIVITIVNCALTLLLARFALSLYLLTLFGLAMVLARLSEARRLRRETT